MPDSSQAPPLAPNETSPAPATFAAVAAEAAPAKAANATKAVGASGAALGAEATEAAGERELGKLGNAAPHHKIESYGFHRFSTATRLVITLALVAFCAVALAGVVQAVISLTQGVVLPPQTYVSMAFAVLLAAALATIVGRFSARGITDPIAKITSTVDQIAGGNYQVRTNFSGYDEIGRLGSTLDEMADTIQRNTEYERQITVDVAHELRTPLMAMQANLEAMIDGIMPTDAEHLITVNSEVLRLGRLVEGQLKLSRLEARKVDFNARRLDLGELITRLISNYQLLVESSDLVLDFAAEPDVMIYADPDMIRQAAANLISNAVRYSQPGGVLRVMVRKRNNAAELEVADTGIGISREDLDNIFNKFWRADKSHDRDRGGLGIGLSLVRELVLIHNGKINVQSQLGVGSSFTIVLPLSE